MADSLSNKKVKKYKSRTINIGFNFLYPQPMGLRFGGKAYSDFTLVFVKKRKTSNSSKSNISIKGFSN